MNELEPREWLLVGREFGVPGEPDAADRWSLDHLFLDQDSIPTLVEVKRGTDTRIRREVVGQMLDYAFNLTNVSAERIRQKFEASISPDTDAEAAIAERFGETTDVEAFWAQLGNNIAAGKLRLVFVADEFPPELRRIVEFLNRQMQQTDVFAVEVRQFISPDGANRTLVPRILGKVEAKNPSGTGVGPGPRWTKERFGEAIESTYTPTTTELLRYAVQSTRRDVDWGTGRDRGSFTARLVTPHHRYSLFSVYTSAEISINVGWSWEFLAEAAPGLTEDFRTRTNAALGTEISQTSWERGWPMIPLIRIRERWPEFIKLIDSFVQILTEVERPTTE